ncbi:MAG: hypothetical protein L3J34_05680 [Flavobacteriaceae bacterium]|nr:hypothetical protein [Flavobacteriaceae bacterium]
MIENFALIKEKNKFVKIPEKLFSLGISIKRSYKVNDERKTNDTINISQIMENDISNIADVDESFFGVNRLNLFKFLFKNLKEICLQIKQENKLKAYVFGRKESNYIQIGPIIANSTALAKKLLCETFIKLKEHSLVIDILLDKTKLKDWLLSIEFTHQRSFTRMYLKSNKYTGKIENQYLISGPEFG